MGRGRKLGVEYARERQHETLSHFELCEITAYAKSEQTIETDPICAERSPRAHGRTLRQ